MFPSLIDGNVGKGTEGEKEGRRQSTNNSNSNNNNKQSTLHNILKTGSAMTKLCDVCYSDNKKTEIFEIELFEHIVKLRIENYESKWEWENWNSLKMHVTMTWTLVFCLFCDYLLRSEKHTIGSQFTILMQIYKPNVEFIQIQNLSNDNRNRIFTNTITTNAISYYYMQYILWNSSDDEFEIIIHINFKSIDKINSVAASEAKRNKMRGRKKSCNESKQDVL